MLTYDKDSEIVENPLLLVVVVHCCCCCWWWSIVVVGGGGGFGIINERSRTLRRARQVIPTAHIILYYITLYYIISYYISYYTQVLRLFARLASLREIINSLTAAILPVM